MRPSGARAYLSHGDAGACCSRFHDGVRCVVGDAGGRACDVPGPVAAPVVDARRAAVLVGKPAVEPAKVARFRQIASDASRVTDMVSLRSTISAPLRCSLPGQPRTPRWLPAKIACRGACAGSHADAQARQPGETPGPWAAAVLDAAICYDIPKHNAAAKAAA